MPTGKSIGSSKSLTFQSHNVRLQISTKFDEVENLLENAFDIFLADVQGMESGSALNVDVQRKSAEANGVERNVEQDGDQITQKSRNCDIQSLDVNVAVTHSDVTFVHLDMDESYNLTIKSRSINE